MDDPDPRLWKGSEEKEEDNFCGLALSESPGGITSSRTFLEAHLASAGAEGLDCPAGARLPVLPCSHPSQPLPPAAEDMDGALAFLRADRPGVERKESLLGAACRPFRGSRPCGGFLNTACPESRPPQGLGLGWAPQSSQGGFHCSPRNRAHSSH